MLSSFIVSFLFSIFTKRRGRNLEQKIKVVHIKPVKKNMNNPILLVCLVTIKND